MSEGKDALGTEMIFRLLVAVLAAICFGLMAWCAKSQLELSRKIEINAKAIAVIQGNRFTATDALGMMRETTACVAELQDKVNGKLDRLTELVYSMSQKIGD